MSKNKKKQPQPQQQPTVTTVHPTHGAQPGNASYHQGQTTKVATGGSKKANRPQG